MGATSFCVAGAALGAPQLCFAWQLRRVRFCDLEHLSFCVAGAAHWSKGGGGPAMSDAFDAASVAALGACSFCVAGAALGAPQAVFSWQMQHLEHLRVVLRVRRSTWSTFIEVGGSPATRAANGSTCCVAGETLGALHAPFAWQVQHFEHLHKGPRKSGDE